MKYKHFKQALLFKVGSLLKFCMWFKYGLKAQKLLAQDIALGIMAISKTPCKGKSFKISTVNSKTKIKKMEKEGMKYEQAVRELEEIVERMENDELDIDQLSEQLKRAKTLVKLCKDKLTKTDEEIKKLLSED